MKCKIVEVPVADKAQAEKVVNEALAALGAATINNEVVLDERRVAIFYTEATAG